MSVLKKITVVVLIAISYATVADIYIQGDKGQEVAFRVKPRQTFCFYIVGLESLSHELLANGILCVERQPIRIPDDRLSCHDNQVTCDDT